MQSIAEIPEDGIMFYPISRGMHTKINASDFKKVSEGTWFAIPCGRKWRVRGRVGSQKQIYLHHYLLGVEGNVLVHHKNGDALDNIRNNIEIATSRINNLNRNGLDPRNKSGYRGVSWNGCSWVANGWLNYKQYYLGSFNDSSEASNVVENFYAAH